MAGSGTMLERAGWSLSQWTGRFLGAGLPFVPLLYSPYLSYPIIWDIFHATDQQLDGLIM